MKLSTSHLFSLLAVSSQLVVADKASTGLPDLDAILKDMNIFIDSTMTKGQDLVIEIEDNSKSFFKDIGSSSKKLFESAKQKQNDIFDSLFGSFSNSNIGSFGPQIVEIELEDGDLPSFEQLTASPNGPLSSAMEPEYVEIVYTVITDEPATTVDFNLDNNLMWIEPSDLSNVNYHLQDSGPEFILKQEDYYTPSFMDDCGGASGHPHALRNHGRFSFVALSGLLVLLSMSLFLFPLMVILSYRRRQQDRGLEYGALPTSDCPPQYFNDEKTRTSSQPEVISPVVVVEEIEEEADENQPLNPSQNHH
jgi:hypothetical protein